VNLNSQQKSLCQLATAELFPNNTGKQQKNDKSAFGSDALDQGSPNYGPWAKCGPRSHFIRPAKPFCQWWKNNISTKNLWFGGMKPFPKQSHDVRSPAL